MAIWHALGAPRIFGLAEKLGGHPTEEDELAREHRSIN